MVTRGIVVKESLMNYTAPTILTSPQGSFSFEWAHDQKIVIARLRGTQPSEVDFYYEQFMELIHTWPRQKPYLIMTDSRQLPNYILTPYMRQKIQIMTEATASSGLRGATVALVSRTPMLILVRTLVENYINRHLVNLPTKFFFDEAEGVKWLLNVGEKMESSQL